MCRWNLKEALKTISIYTFSLRETHTFWDSYFFSFSLLFSTVPALPFSLFPLKSGLDQDPPVHDQYGARHVGPCPRGQEQGCSCHILRKGKREGQGRAC